MIKIIDIIEQCFQQPALLRSRKQRGPGEPDVSYIRYRLSEQQRARGRDDAMNRNIRVVLFLITGVFVVFPAIARGSLAVKYALVGCIKESKFYMSGAATPELVGSEIKSLEGKTIRVEGFLFPGDRFSAVSIFIVDDQCRNDLHKKYFLCHPCRTLPSGPPSKPAPRREQGSVFHASPEVIKQFDNLPHLLKGFRQR